MRKMLLLLLVLTAVPAFADPPKAENFERGFAPQKAYQFGNLDNVSLFNGNLVVTLPLGNSYALGGGTSYAFTLVYNGNFWDFIDLASAQHPATSVHWSYPSPHSNAGAGWSLSLGRVLGDGDVQNRTGADVYLSPDGNEHQLIVSAPIASRDGSFLRWKDGHLESRDGVKRWFNIPDPDAISEVPPPSNTTGWLTEMRDANGNWLKVQQTLSTDSGVGGPLTPGEATLGEATLVQWTITDSVGRTHYIYFRVIDGVSVPDYAPAYQTLSNYKVAIEKVDLQTAGGRAVYTFKYGPDDAHAYTATTVQQSCDADGTNEYATSFDIPYLRKVELPDQSTYEMSYLTPSGNCTDGDNGALTRLKLPTGGAIAWEYGRYLFPRFVCGAPDGAGSTTGVYGVRKRTAFDRDGASAGITTYSPQLTDPVDVHCPGSTFNEHHPIYQQMINTVTLPNGRVEKNHFTTVLPDAGTASTLDDQDYGSPQCALTTDDDGRGLSVESIDCSYTPCDTRKKFIEWKFYDGILQEGSGNPVPKSESTQFGTDKTRRIVTVHSENDGYGHWKTTTLTSAFGDPVRVTHTNFTPDVTNWILDKYTEQTATEGAASVKSLFCFDANGFLRRTRTLAGDAPSARDLLAVFAPDLHGNVASEKYYGGDGGTLDTSTDCEHDFGTPAYAIDHTYEYGTLKSTSYMNGTATVLRQMQRTIDPSGAILEEIDPSGLITKFTYTPWGAYETITPPDQTPSVFTYENAGATSPAKTTITQGEQSVTYMFDGLGRPVREKRRLPNAGNEEQYSIRETTYDAAGRRKTVSEAERLPAGQEETFHPSHVTTFDLYDGYDRPRKTTAPDLSVTTADYNGITTMTRESQVATKAGLVAARTTETYDGRGRLIKVDEPAGGTSADAPVGANVVTQYTYDIGNRLATVVMSGDGHTQTRQFQYDNRGFLTSEQHPEIGADGNGVITYEGYDARGHAAKKVTGGSANFTLQFTYDKAERLTQVSDAAGNALKQFQFGTSTDCLYCAGRLLKAIRHNRFTEGPLSGSDYQVTETYDYNNQGLPKTRVTEVKNVTSGAVVQTFTQQFAYDALGEMTSVGYPTTSVAAAGQPALSALPNRYANGFLVAVPGYAGDETTPGFTYQPSGMVNTVIHQNGVTDRYDIDPATAMSRPSKIAFENWKNCSAPDIQQQPANVSFSGTTAATLKVVAGGAMPLAYQWYAGVAPGGEKIEGAVFDTYTIENPQPGSYWVRVSNGCGTADSRTAAVSAGCAPAIDVQPASASVPVNGTVTLTVGASGTNLSYQWYKNGTALAGATAESYTITAATETADYYVTVTGCTGALTSQPVKVTVTADCTPAVIVAPPPDVTSYTANTNRTLTVGATGTGPLHYEWFVVNDTGAATLTGVDSPTLLVNVSRTTRFRVKVTGPCGPAAGPVDIVVHVTSCSGVSITAQPADQRVATGGTARLYIDGTAPGVPIFTWYGGPWGNTSQPSLGLGTRFTTPAVTDEAHFWCRVSWPNGNCEVDSRLATVSVCKPPHIGVHPQSEVVTAGASADLRVVATGDRLDYQWFEGEAGDTTKPQVSGTPRFRPLVPQTPGRTPFWVRVTGECGVQDSNTAWVTFCVAPSIDTQPNSFLDLVYGQSAALSVVASDPQQRTLSYTWILYDDPQNEQILGAGSSVTVPATLEAGTHWIRVRVSNGDCSTDSIPTRVDVCVPPAVAMPDDVVTAAMQSVHLQIATQSGVTYTWYRGAAGDVSHTEGTGDHIDVAPSTTTSYWVRAAKGVCITDAPAVTVRVCKPAITTQPVSTEITLNGTATLTVEAAGTMPFTYQWYEGAAEDTRNPISDSDKKSISVSPAATTNYWASVMTGCGGAPMAAWSTAATVTVCNPPLIAAAPADRFIVLGQSATLTATATGTNLQYQWYKGASGDTAAPVTGATSSSVTVTPNATSQYWLRVSGRCGTKDSSAATVTVCIPPPITTQPASTGVVDGQTATISVVTSAANVTYQWYEGTAPDTSHPAGTAQSFTTPALTATTSYWVRISNGQCSSDSATATVSVCKRPVITNQPANQSNATAGNSVTLSVAATPANPADPLRYDWYSGASGDTSQPYALNTTNSISPAPFTTTSYWVRVSGGGCSRDSAAAVVDVCVPRINTQPQDVSIVQGATATLTVAATGTAPLSYQWYTGTAGNTSSPIAGATNASVTVTPAQSATYWVQVKSPCATASAGAASRTVTVTVCVPAHVATDPAGVNITLGQSATLSVGATGTNPRYAWYAGPAGVTSTPLNSTTSTVTFSPSQTTQVWARVTGDCGPASDSGVATVDVCVPPSVSTQPANTIIPSGSTATFSVAASGTSLSYQWYEGQAGDTANPVTTNGTSSTLTTRSLTSDASFWVRITSKNRCWTNSTAAVAQICVPPDAYVSPQTSGISAGQQITLSVAPGAASYAWYRGASGNTTSGILGMSYSYDAAPQTTTSYWVRVGNGYCTADSAAATVNVCIPAISVQPASTSVVQTHSATLSVTASSATGYQWYIGSAGNTAQPVSGATSPALTVTPSSTTTYWVRVSGSCSSVNSQAATVTVTPCTPPAVQAAPQPATIQSGTSATLSVSATGTALTYQWWVADPQGPSFTAVPSSNSATITVRPSATKADYYVVVSNACGSVRSPSTGAVTVTTVTCTSPAITQQPASITYTPGTSVTFSVGATGTNLHYQWYRSDPSGAAWLAVTGGTSATLTIVPANAQASFFCHVTSDCGTVDSTVAVASPPPCQPADIYASTQSMSVSPGTMVMLEVDANGSNLQYNWEESTDGIHYYSISQSPIHYVWPSSTTYYYCNVSNECSATGTDVIVVTVDGSSLRSPAKPRAESNSASGGRSTPLILAQPLSLTIPPNGVATLSIAADRGEYQWFVSTDGRTFNAIPSATDAILTVSPAARAYYFARVINGGAAINSAVATVTVAPAPLATPVYRSLTDEAGFAPGALVTLEVRASGANVHYHWFKSDPSGSAFVEAGGDSPRLTDTPAGAEALYFVRIANEGSFVDTPLMVARSTACSAPTVTSQPRSTVVNSGAATTLETAASGQGPLTYQWFGSNAGNTLWTALPGATSASIAITPHETSFYYCVITSACGNSVTSATAAVEVNPQ
jgi:hypothetical protein